MTRAVEPAPAEEAELLTIDQLAARSGISVRTIRFYSGKSLLPPPALRGRLGLYGPDHLARLELITELSALGFTLASIEGYLTRVPASAGHEAVALQRALLVPWVPERLEELTLEELDRRAGRPLSSEDLVSLEALGVLENRAAEGATATGTVLLHGTISLAAALESLEIGFPVEALRRSHAVIAKHTAALAEELMQLFQDDVLQPYRDRGRPATERADLREAFTRLKPITVQGVVTAFGRAVNRTIRERFGAEEN